MLTGDSLTRAIVEDVRIVAHDSQWAAQFEVERERLLVFLPGRFAAIEHIGSTAVPGLAAKPIIGILAGVSTMSRCLAGAFVCARLRNFRRVQRYFTGSSHGSCGTHPAGELIIFTSLSSTASSGFSE